MLWEPIETSESSLLSLRSGTRERPLSLWCKETEKVWNPHLHLLGKKNLQTKSVLVATSSLVNKQGEEKWKKNHSHKQRQSIQQKQNHSNVVWLLYMENAQDVINQCVSASWATEFLGASLTQSWALKQLCMTQNCGKINPLELTVSVCLFSLAAVNRPGQLVHGVSWKHAHQHTLSHHFTVPGKEAWRGCRNDVSSVDSRAIHDYSSVKRTHMHSLTHLHTLMICQRHFNTTWPTLLYSRIDVDINLSWREFHQRSIDSYFQWKGY